MGCEGIDLVQQHPGQLAVMVIERPVSARPTSYRHQAHARMPRGLGRKPEF